MGASSNLALTTKNNKVMLKSKNEIENYEEKAKFLQENGWKLGIMMITGLKLNGLNKANLSIEWEIQQIEFMHG